MYVTFDLLGKFIYNLSKLTLRLMLFLVLNSNSTGYLYEMVLKTHCKYT